MIILIQVQTRSPVQQRPLPSNHPLSIVPLPPSTPISPSHLPHSPRPHLYSLPTNIPPHSPHRDHVRSSITCCANPFCSPVFSVDATINTRERLRSLVEFITEGTRETDQVISNMRNLLAGVDDTTFEDPAPPTPGPTPRPPGERLLPPSSATPISPSPYPSPSPSPSARLDRPLRTPVVRRTRDISSPSAIDQIGETVKDFPGTPKYNGMVSSITGAFDPA